MAVFLPFILTAFAVSSQQKGGFEINNVSEPPTAEELRIATMQMGESSKNGQQEEVAGKDEGGVGSDTGSDSEGAAEFLGDGADIDIDEEPEMEEKDVLLHPGVKDTYTAAQLKEKFGIVRKRTHNEYGEELLYNEEGEELIDPGTPENQVNVALGILLHACNDDRVPQKECDNLHKMLGLPPRVRNPDAWPKIEFDADGYRKVLWPNLDHPDNAHLRNHPAYGGSSLNREKKTEESHEAAKARWEQEERESKAKYMQQQAARANERKEADELAKLEEAAEKLRVQKEARKREQERREKEELDELAKLEQAAEKLRAQAKSESEREREQLLSAL